MLLWIGKSAQPLGDVLIGNERMKICGPAGDESRGLAKAESSFRRRGEKFRSLGSLHLGNFNAEGGGSGKSA
jgi:hypothetical protein